jgi:hypothetical protein
MTCAPVNENPPRRCTRRSAPPSRSLDTPADDRLTSGDGGRHGVSGRSRRRSSAATSRGQSAAGRAAAPDDGRRQGAASAVEAERGAPCPWRCRSRTREMLGLVDRGERGTARAPADCRSSMSDNRRRARRRCRGRRRSPRAHRNCANRGSAASVTRLISPPGDAAEP